ncbi:hypothetical protein SCALM49S_05284 [Streptomyces californicus]
MWTRRTVSCANASSTAVRVTDRAAYTVSRGNGPVRLGRAEAEPDVAVAPDRTEFGGEVLEDPARIAVGRVLPRGTAQIDGAEAARSAAVCRATTSLRDRERRVASRAVRVTEWEPVSSAVTRRRSPEAARERASCAGSGSRARWSRCAVMRSQMLWSSSAAAEGSGGGFR